MTSVKGIAMTAAIFVPNLKIRAFAEAICQCGYGMLNSKSVDNLYMGCVEATKIDLGQKRHVSKPVEKKMNF